ncbi:MAG: hypothetical protein KatS3mg124_2328 [Porticoccaceae bacterium]|nr:MAG: hypothetical protein KatS3mg124_2328 [Porticoccaceae bacterium]
MSLSNFAELLQAWEQRAREERAKVRFEVACYRSDELKLRALAEVFHLPFEEVVASLLHHALLAVEEKMPYVPGEKVIRVEDSGEVYEDVGPMARYLEVLRRLKRERREGVEAD